MLKEWGKGAPEEKLKLLLEAFASLNQAKTEKQYADAARAIRDSIRRS